MDCACEQCRRACTVKPGWFKPKEIAPAAALLGLTEQEFFDRHLLVDWLGLQTENGDARFVYVLSPALDDGQAGREFGVEPGGVCHFLKNGLCSIHAAKPHECRAYDHTFTKEQSDHLHQEELGEAWDAPGPQAYVRQLLGREPRQPGPEEYVAWELSLRLKELFTIDLG